MSQKTVVISFSGGRTSAFMVWTMCKKAAEMGWEVRIIFMDTGGEHPATYQFIKDIAKYWGIEIECIRIVINPKLRGGNGWERVPVESLRFDMTYMTQLVAKLGTFTKTQGHCTRDMKQRTHDKYVAEMIGRGHEVWLGMRFDEPARLWGKRAYKALRDMGLSPDEAAQLWSDIASGDKSSLFNLPGAVHVRLRAVSLSGLHYLAEISDAEKSDILEWWKGQPFDLQIEEHLGNCVFCVKKNAKKIALAVRDEPELARQWLEMHTGDHVRTENLPSRDPAKSSHIYRDVVTGRPVSMEHVIKMFEPFSREELYRQMKFSGGEDAGSCSESCEVFGGEE